MPLSALGKREAVGRLRVREEGRVEIHADLLALGPIDPALEMLRLDLVAIDAAAAELAVEGVQVEAVLAGDQREGLVQVGAKFLGRAGLAGIVARDREAAAEFFARVLEAADVVALPAVERDRNRGEPLDGRVGVDAEFGVTFFRGRVGRLDRWFVGAHRKGPPEIRDRSLMRRLSIAV